MSLRQRKALIETLEYESLKESDLTEKRRTILYPTSIGILIAVIPLILCKWMVHLDSQLPKQVSLAEEITQPSRFIGERAETFTRKLSDLGARVVGSLECEVLAANLINKEIDLIVKSADPIHNILVDVQKPSGSFYLGFKPFGFQSVYENIQNIVVRIGPQHHAPDSILLNCHFDSVLESPGASDNALNCGVMMETFRKLSRQKFALRHNVIFLFNGAEENPLQGSHGFITQHPWSEEVRVVINLDSAGAGGRETLFQITPEHPWLLKIYGNSVPYPSGSVMSQEIFHSGIIPSDTDFRIFRDFGKIIGYDLAHCDNGYIYHTRLDQMSFINRGVHQHTGDNILALVRALAYADQLRNIESHAENSSSSPFYADIFGHYFVILSSRSATLISIMTIVISLYLIVATLKQVRDGVQWSILTSILGWALSISSAIFLSRLLDATGVVLTWYRKPWLCVVLYGLPSIVATVWPLIFKQLTPRGQVNRAVHATLAHHFLLTVLLILGVAFDIRSSFLFVFFLLPNSVLGIIALKLGNFSPVRFVLIEFLGSLLPLSFFFYCAVKLFIVLIPIAGRSGEHTDVELIIAILTCSVCLVGLGYTTAVLLILKNPRFVLKVLLAIHGIYLLLILTTPFGFPYTENIFEPAPQRFFLIHSERTFHDAQGLVRKNDSGVFVVPLDRNGVKYVKSFNHDLHELKSLENDCKEEIVCGFPIYTSRYLALAKGSKWLPFEKPDIKFPAFLNLTHQGKVDETTKRLFFSLVGPDHIVLLLQLRENCQLINWTLAENDPIPARFNNKDVYVIYFSDGLLSNTQHFSFDVKTEIGKKEEEPVLDVVVIGHYMHHKANYHPKFNLFLTLFPKWSQPISWVTTVTSWVF